MFESKRIIFKKKQLKGKHTFLVPAQDFSKEIFLFFSSDDLHQIFNSNSKALIRNLIQKPWNIFIDLYSSATNKKFGFLWIIINDDINLDITVHGGGWNKSLASGKLFLDSWRTAIDFLTLNFKQVRTSCKINNTIAENFITNSGFKRIKSDRFFNYYII
jgi:hypothetical protein